jgi:hypothetical protein
VPAAARVALAFVLALILPASAGAVVKSGFDRHAGMRLTLDGRVLTAKIVKTPHIHRDPTTEKRLYGKRIDGICSPHFRPQRRGLVISTQLWPAGARRVAFEFARDISRRVKWCLIEHDAGDVAFVSFIQRERPMFVGKGRGPSGEWWRLAGWRGLFAEPCALLRIRGWGTRPCFEEFSDRPVTLGASEFSVCGRRDVFVLGVVSRRAESVRVVTAAGETFEAKLFDPAGGSRVRGRYFVAALPEVTPTRVESLDAGGSIIARRPLEGRPPGLCES